VAQFPSSLWVLAIIAWFAASVAYRFVARKGIFASPQPAAAFAERWASGRFGTGLISRLSTARNCLQVQVTARELIVTPHFPFTLGFMPEIYDLDQRIPVVSVRKAASLGGAFAQAIEITYLRQDGKEGALQLLLRRGDEFLHHLQAARDAA